MAAKIIFMKNFILLLVIAVFIFSCTKTKPVLKENFKTIAAPVKVIDSLKAAAL